VRWQAKRDTALDLPSTASVCRNEVSTTCVSGWVKHSVAGWLLDTP